MYVIFILSISSKGSTIFSYYLIFFPSSCKVYLIKDVHIVLPDSVKNIFFVFFAHFLLYDSSILKRKKKKESTDKVKKKKTEEKQSNEQ